MGLFIAIGGSSVSVDTSSSYKYLYSEDVSRYFAGAHFSRATIVMDETEVSDASYMFYGCTNLTILKIVGIRLSDNCDTSQMFYGCTKLQQVELDVDDSTFAKITAQLANDGLSVAVSKDSSISNSNGILIGGVFHAEKECTFNFELGEDCRAYFSGSTFVEAALSGIETSHVTNMSHMFYGCENVKKLDLSSFRTSNVTDMSAMFKDCVNVSSIDLSNFDMSSIVDCSDMFAGCDELREVNVMHCSYETITRLLSQLTIDSESWKKWERRGDILINPIVRINLNDSVAPFENGGGLGLDDWDDLPIAEQRSVQRKKVIRKEITEDAEETKGDDNMTTITTTVTVDPVKPNN